MNKQVGYAVLAVVTSPIWMPVAFAGYVGYRATNWAFHNPKSTVGLLAGAGLLWYVTGSRGQEFRSSIKETAVQLVAASQRQKVKGLEEKIRELEVKSMRSENKFTAYEKQKPEFPLTNIALNEKKTVGEDTEEKPVKISATAEFITDPFFNFYYVKPGETLSGIAQRTMGSASMYQTIMTDNHVQNTRTVVAGTLLKLRKRYCVPSAKDVKSSVRRLSSVELSGAVRISAYFPEQAADILSLNRELGLPYNDEFPYRNGSRIVYYH